MNASIMYANVMKKARKNSLAKSSDLYQEKGVKEVY